MTTRHPGVTADAFVRACPSRPLLARVGQAWTGLAVAALADRPLRFAELRRRLDGVSQKMLTETLRGLERDGLVSRTVHDTPLARVDYALTPLGRELLPAVQQLKGWAEDRWEAVEACRARYDAAAAASA